MLTDRTDSHCWAPRMCIIMYKKKELIQDAPLSVGTMNLRTPTGLTGTAIRVTGFCGSEMSMAHDWSVCRKLARICVILCPFLFVCHQRIFFISLSVVGAVIVVHAAVREISRRTVGPLASNNQTSGCVPDGKQESSSNEEHGQKYEVNAH